MCMCVELKFIENTIRNKQLWYDWAFFNMQTIFYAVVVVVFVAVVIEQLSLNLIQNKIISIR